MIFLYLHSLSVIFQVIRLETLEGNVRSDRPNPRHRVLEDRRVRPDGEWRSTGLQTSHICRIHRARLH